MLLIHSAHVPLHPMRALQSKDQHVRSGSSHCGSMTAILCCCGRVFLLFEAVGSAFYCWLNGAWLGYSQDSCLPAEFDVTAQLQPGANTLAVQVRRFFILVLTKPAAGEDPSDIFTSVSDHKVQHTSTQRCLRRLMCLCRSCGGAMAATWRTRYGCM